MTSALCSVIAEKTRIYHLNINIDDKGVVSESKKTLILKGEFVLLFN